MQYLESIKENISNIVYQTYKHQCECRIREYFDKHKLRLIDVGTEEIKDFYDYLKGEGLKNITLRHYACVLRPALRQAYKDKLIPDNPYDFVPSLKMDKTPMDFYEKMKLQSFLK